MTISSRTPEGDPNICPICGHRVRMEPSIDTRDAPCPNCGYLLWFTEAAIHESGISFADDSARKKAPKELVLTFATKRFGPPTSKMKASMNVMHRRKFEKIDWERLVKTQCWADVLEVVGAQNR